MPPIPHPLDMPKKRLKQTIHSLCSPLNVPQQQNNSLGLPLSFMNYEQTTFTYNPLNIELSSTTAKELAQFTLQLYHYSLKLALYQSTSPQATLHATLHAEIYKPTFKTLTGSSNVSESWKETTRNSKENSSANAVKWPNVLSGRFRTGSPRPLRTFAPGQCIPASAIMQFRRNVYEYSTKKTPPITSVCKVNANRLVNIFNNFY